MTSARGSWLLLAIALVVAPPLPSRQVAAQDAVNEPDLSAVTLTENDCSILIRYDEDPRPKLGDINCGTLDVPENWADPGGRRLQIAYVVLQSDDPSPAPDPVVYLEGGPGGSALTGAEVRADFFKVMRQERDVILFDQRGTRLSSPLRCQAYSAGHMFAPPEATGSAAEAPASTPAPVPRFPVEMGDAYEIMQAARQQQAAAAADCVREITATGVDLRQYNSIASARDTVALIKALGYDNYNLYGISYGTRLALVIMRDHPRSGIRSVVLDSTFPPEIKGFERYPDEPHEVVIQLFADCALDPACGAAFPNLKARFVKLLAHLHETPVLTEDGIAIDDRDLAQVMQGLAQNVRAVPYVPLMIEELERGEDDTFIAIVSGTLFEPAPVEEPVSAEEIDRAAREAAEAAAGLAPDIAANASPARLFLLSLESIAAAMAEDEGDQMLALLLGLDDLPPDRGTLEELVRTAYADPSQEDDRDLMLGLVAGMSKEDVQEVFAAVTQTVTLFDFLTFGTSPIQFNSVECNEEIPFQSFENTVAIARQLEIPELALGVLDVMAGQFAICEVWPSGRAPAIEDSPVASDVPTLILSGAYDLQTPVSWNKSAFVTLPNGFFVEFPMTGHAVIAQSECAERVAAAFVERPIDLPDITCVADLKPQWVLPQENLPATPVALIAPVAPAA